LKDWGWEVEVFLYGDADRLPPDAVMNYARWMAMGAVRDFASFDHDCLADCTLLIDAVFGTGLTRGLSEDIQPILDVVKHFGWAGAYLCAIDAPSGLCLDSGRVLGEAGRCFRADLTVTFAMPKIGHFIAHGPAVCGKVVTVDIGLDRQSARKALATLHDQPGTVTSLHPFDVRNTDRLILDRLSKGRSPNGHKFSHGHALILSGPPGKGGAARMAARGALRIGAGLLTLGVPPPALTENAARLDAVMLGQVGDAGALAEMLSDTRITAVCLGPGLGTREREATLLAAVLGDRGVKPRPTLLDADALTLLSRDAGLFARLHPACVLTPHGGEFARLFPDIAARLAQPAAIGPAYSKVDATRDAAKRAGCVVLYKGADTVIADPDGRCSVNSAYYENAAPWLATAGSGDVLAGFITGLLARGFPPMEAAETGAWLHVACARSFGPGLIAEDLPDALPGVFRGLGL
jgi:hydroxyethylthiazole kinase-like uncharacterized protein yjeF